MKTIQLRPGRERSLQRRHPWVFEGSVAKGGADAGELVRVVGHDGQFLAWGAFSPASAIRVRAWSFDEAQRIDAAFLTHRLQQAVAWRGRLGLASNGQRLVHGEADGLPGLIVDRYADVLSVQFGAAGVDRWRETIADALLQATGLTRLYERSDASVRALAEHVVILDEPTAALGVKEGNMVLELIRRVRDKGLPVIPHQPQHAARLRDRRPHPRGPPGQARGHPEPQDHRHERHRGRDDRGDEARGHPARVPRPLSPKDRPCSRASTPC